MSVLALVVVIILLGLLCWGANMIPIPAWAKMAVNIVCAIIAVLLILEAFGILDTI